MVEILFSRIERLGAVSVPIDALLDGARLLTRHDGVVEVRILKTPKGTVSGYFDSLDALVKAVRSWDSKANIYITANPVKPELLARAHNRLREFARETTADREILRRVWFLTDFDPMRPAGISATDAEVQAALDRRNEAVAFCRELGFSEPALGMSGNGGHALWAVDLPNDEASRRVVERALKALSVRFSDQTVTCDEAVFNAARVWKLYGTMAVKGDPLPDRPHRRTTLERVPAELTLVAGELLQALAASAPAEAIYHALGSRRAGDLEHLDLVGALQARGLYRRALDRGKHAVTCPWADQHSTESGGSDTCIFEPPAPGQPWGFDCRHAHCASRTIRDLLAYLNLGARWNGHGSEPATGPDDRADAWPDPQPVPTDLRPVPLFDVDQLLPAAFSPWVRDIAERAQCPVDYVGVAAVVTAGAVIGRAVTIRPKRHDDWAVVPNLWGFAIGRPGIMKTPALQEAVKPLYRLVTEARKAHQEEQAEADFLEAEAAIRREEWKKALREAIRAGRPTDALKEEFAGTAPTRPTERRYVVNDSTVEKLGELLNQNPNGLLLFRDELSGFLRLMDREGHENDRAFYNEAWNGTGRYTYDRIGRGTVHIEAACVSILGGIQPGPLHAYLRECAAGGGDDGFVQRFQLMVYPDVDQSWQNVDRWPDTTVKQRVFDVFERLAHLDPEAVGAHTDAPGALPFLRFEPAAQGVFDVWRAALEARLRGADEHPAVTAHLSKYRSLMPSLALIFHLVECAAGGTGGPVSAAAATRAVAWCKYLEAHARRVYQSVTDAGRLATAALAARITRGDLPTPFRARDVYRRAWSGLINKDDVHTALDALVDLGWLRREDVRGERGGRPTVQYRVNPAVIDACAGSGGFVGASPRGVGGKNGGGGGEEEDVVARASAQNLPPTNCQNPQNPPATWEEV